MPSGVVTQVITQVDDEDDGDEDAAAPMSRFSRHRGVFGSLAVTQTDSAADMSISKSYRIDPATPRGSIQ